MTQIQKQTNRGMGDTLLIIYRSVHESNIEHEVVTSVVITVGEECGIKGLSSANMAVMDIADAGGLWISSTVFIPYHMIKKVVYQPANQQPPVMKQVPAQVEKPVASIEEKTPPEKTQSGKQSNHKGRRHFRPYRNRPNTPTSPDAPASVPANPSPKEEAERSSS
ncbi:MAG: hypothetical protein WC375_12985 [Methanomassiliicoccales archaeon]|jgi:hypothetical protein